MGKSISNCSFINLSNSFNSITSSSFLYKLNISLNCLTVYLPIYSFSSCILLFFILN